MGRTDRRYHIDDVLGRGGFGTVYRATLTDNDGFTKAVAVKLLNDAQAHAEVLQRFRDEARILGLLRDRAIVQVDPPVQLGGRWAVVMELVDGASLSRLLKRHGSFPPRVALEVIAEVARALDKAIHQPGPDGRPLRLVHRDLKPGNIQLTQAGEVKILDFGIARADFDQREAKTTHGIVGTPGYIAPERFDGHEDPKGDVFSLGGVLFKLLCGGLPGEGKDEALTGDARRALGLAIQMRSAVELRPSAREVEAAAHALMDELAGPKLRLWCEDHVPSASRMAPDELVGEVLTESVPTDAAGPSSRPPSSRPTTAASPVAAPRRPRRARRELGFAGWVAVSAAVFLSCAGVGLGAARVYRVYDAPPVAPATPAATPPPAPAEAPVTAPIAEPAAVEPAVAEPEEAPAAEPQGSVEPPVAAPSPPRPAPVPRPAVEPVAAAEPKPSLPTLLITVGSVPMGLPVTVGGAPTGKKTPAALSLPVGAHTITVDGVDRVIEVGERLPRRYVLKAGRWESFAE